MAPWTVWRCLRAFAYTLALSLAPAFAADDQSFDDAARVADASLDTMRGGFALPDGSQFNFAVNLQTSVDGVGVGSLQIAEQGGNFQAQSTNLGRTVSINPEGNLQIATALPGPGAATVTTTFTAVGSAPIGGSASVAAIPTAVPLGINAATTSGHTLATTTLLPGGGGVLTLVQNVKSNVTLQLLQTINIEIGGVSGNLVNGNTVHNVFANSLVGSLRH